MRARHVYACVGVGMQKTASRFKKADYKSAPFMSHGSSVTNDTHPNHNQVQSSLHGPSVQVGVKYVVQSAGQQSAQYHHHNIDV